MKTLLIIMMAFTLSGYVVAGDHKHKGHKHGETTSEMKVVYACPMHPEVTSEIKERCPKCKMYLMPQDEKKKESSK